MDSALLPVTRPDILPVEGPVRLRDRISPAPEQVSYDVARTASGAGEETLDPIAQAENRGLKNFRDPLRMKTSISIVYLI